MGFPGMNLTTRCLAVALIAGILTGCSRQEPSTSASAHQSIAFTATLLTPIDIKLTWKDPAPNVAGHIVEYATEPQGEFTTLGFFPPDQETFTHPNLMPETNWYYRVRPYYGPASNPLHVALPATLSDKEYARRNSPPADSPLTPRHTSPDGVSP